MAARVRNKKYAAQNFYCTFLVFGQYRRDVNPFLTIFLFTSTVNGILGHFIGINLKKRKK